MASLIEDMFRKKKKKKSLSNSKSDDEKQRLETMGRDKHSMVIAP